MGSEVEKLAEAHAIRAHGRHPNDKDARDNCAHDFRSGYAQAVKDAEAECKTVEGKTTHWYRGDSMTANELLARLQERCGE